MNESFTPWVLWAFLLWGVELFFFSQVPVLRILAAPLLLFLIFVGFRLPSGRFLWAIGAALGFLRDIETGALWGGFACTFALVGWILHSGRHLVEREDPLVRGIWAGILTGISGLVYGVLLQCADPAMGWNGWMGWFLPAAMVANGMVAAWSFPRLQRILR